MVTQYHVTFRMFLILFKFSVIGTYQGPVVQSPISANPGLTP